MKLYSRALGEDEVLEIFQHTADQSGFAGSGAACPPCTGSQYCTPRSALTIASLGAAHDDGGLTGADYDDHRRTLESPAVHPGCLVENALMPDGQYAGLSLPDGVRSDGST